MLWRCGNVEFKTGGGAPPLIMGVVNVTPDSFSDGGAFLRPQAAVARGMQLLADGADILDIGGESTRPGARPVAAAEESRRVLPVVEALAKAGAVVSIDTGKPQIMRAAAAAGAKIINDVRGFAARGAARAAAESGCGLALMHKRGAPATMQKRPQYDDVTAQVRAFLAARAAALLAAGAAAERLCLDPGIGFGKTLEHNLALLARLRAIGNLADLLPALGRRPVLAGVSRKSMFAAIAARPQERDTASAVAATLLAGRGAHVLRVHNARATKQALAAAALLRQKPPPAAARAKTA